MLKKIMHSKFMVGLLCFVMLLVPMTTMARGYYSYNDIYVDGYYVYMDVPPVIDSGRTLVPVRAVSEALGCDVQWSSYYQCVDVYAPNGNLLMTMYLGSYYADVYYGYGVESIYMDAAADVYDGRVMVPLRFIAETLGLSVNYDSYSGDIYINSYGY